MRLGLSVLVLAAAAVPAVGWTAIGPGIEYEDFQLDDPNNLFVARMDRHHPACAIESSIGLGRLSGGRERVTGQAGRYDDAIGFWRRDWGMRNDVVVAINGDFFDLTTGVPTNGQVHSGWYAKQSQGPSPAFGWTLGRDAFIVGGLDWDPRVVYLASGGTQTIKGINRARGTDELVLFTPQFDSDTKTSNAGVEVLVEMTRPTLITPQSDPVRGTVRQVRQNQGSTPIPFDHVVLSASGTAATTLLANAAVGAGLGFSLSTDGGNWNKAYAGIGGGEVFLAYGFVRGGQDVRHPRTAIAFNDDYVFFVVVDGRDPGVSVGMTMTEIGNFCLNSLGAAWGINQDGGGSSTMVVNGVIKNNPSDGSERTVANGMMMVVMQPKTQSTAFQAGDQARTTASSNVRLGPGTNYTALTTVPANTQGVILDHSLRGIDAKGFSWWKCDFAGTEGWVAESLLALVAQGNLPRFTQHPAEQLLCPGENAAFGVSATGTGTLTYRWQKDGSDLSDDARHVGTATANLAVTGVVSVDEGSYRCVVTGATGGVTSYSAALALREPIAITQQPVSQDTPPVLHRTDVTFAIVATGETPISFQWQKNGAGLSDGGHYSGTATPTLMIDDADSSDNGAYRCRVSGGCGTEFSDEAILKVAFADFDGDLDVDLEDFGHIQACMTGYGNPQTDPACLDARLDADADVDDTDLLIFHRCHSGAGVPADPNCPD